MGLSSDSASDAFLVRPYPSLVRGQKEAGKFFVFLKNADENPCFYENEDDGNDVSFERYPK